MFLPLHIFIGAAVMSNAQMILDQIDLVKLDINLWTSSKKLRPEDLVLADGSKLPPEDLASLGTKKTIHPDKLKEFNRIKKEAERICLESGTRFIGGFANPRTEIPRITKQLDALSKEFYVARDQFLASYTADTEIWINAHSEFSEAIRRAIEPVESVASKLHFDYIIFRVTKPDPDQEESIERRALSMSDQLFREIAQDASMMIDRSFVGKDTVTARVLNGFRRIRDKLDSLGFLDFRCMPVVDEIDHVLDQLPKSGPYNGVAFHSLFRLGMLLSDPQKIIKHGGGLLQPVPVHESENNYLEDINITDQDFIIPLEEKIFQKSEDNSLLEKHVIDHEINDDLPGFDNFLLKYNGNQDDLIDDPVQEFTKVPVEDIFKISEVVIEQNIAISQVPIVVPAQSISEAIADSDEAGETKEYDFFF